ncbi:hypothetical protein [Clostridium sp.]|uniref:hypothetical protein n=1 Tax=Clostridium sp. TaxID=1506 RepID=UPI0025C319AF|nr:hypothetical protein [Clostridium sp.]
MCLTSCLMGQENIVVLKATKDTINDIIEKGIYTLTNLPNNYNQFEKFVLVDDTDENKAKVLAMGNLSEPFAINENNKSFNSYNNYNWKWGYQLSNIVDLRENTLTLKDVFMEENLDKISYTVQF